MMNPSMKIALLIPLCAAQLFGASLKAGVARAEITPGGPIWMSGYAARTHASEGVLGPLWAKALALESSRGARIVIVTTDVIGIPRAVADEVAQRVQRQYGLKRWQFLLNASHTHTGPMVWPNLLNLAVLPPQEIEKLPAYGRKFTEALVSVIGGALRDLAPATVEFGQGSAGFAINRRRPPAGSTSGPVDHKVPVLKISDAAGKLRAILFGYACHNTTLTGEFYQISGDYAGLAAEALESRHAGATALFMMLCGADQNPNPRSTLELARQHGAALAAEVEQVLAKPMTSVSGPVKTVFRLTRLQLAPRSRQNFETELKSTLAAGVRRAEMMIKALDAGRKIDQVDYPVQAVRFGNSLTLIALGGEVVVDYGLRIQREYPGEPIITAGYSNDVMCYIPSLRVLKEGGYEAVDSMIYYGQSGPFADDIEDRVFKAIHQVMKDIGRGAPQRD
jgi:neutral/alkaline ceramidase-like enzyme